MPRKSCFRLSSIPPDLWEHTLNGDPFENVAESEIAQGYYSDAPVKEADDTPNLEQQIIGLLFGLFGGSKLDFHEIAYVLRIPQQRVAEVYSNVLHGLAVKYRGLPERRRTILRLHLGLSRGGEESFAEVSRHLGISRQRVHKVFQETIQRLQQGLLEAASEDRASST